MKFEIKVETVEFILDTIGIRYHEFLKQCVDPATPPAVKTIIKFHTIPAHRNALRELVRQLKSEKKINHYWKAHSLDENAWDHPKAFNPEAPEEPMTDEQKADLKHLTQMME